MISVNDLYVTVVGFDKYCGIEPFGVGSYLLCQKESNNPVDEEALAVYSYSLKMKLGYVANSYRTRAKGTLSAGRLYDKFFDSVPLRVCFITKNKVICKICLEGLGICSDDCSVESNLKIADEEILIKE